MREHWSGYKNLAALPILSQPTFWPPVESPRYSVSGLVYATQRVLALASQGGCDPGEVLWAVARMNVSDYASWERAFTALAADLQTLAETSSSPISVRDAYLRASLYWSMAGRYVYPQDGPTALGIEAKATQCMTKAAPNLEHELLPVSIPYGQSILNGYLAKPTKQFPRPPVVMFGLDWDSRPEQRYFVLGRYLASRGIAVILVDNFGHGISRSRDKIVLPIEIEKSAGVIIDWALQRSDIDATRFGIVAFAAGFYATRVAALDSRVKAVVGWGGLDGEMDTADFSMSITGIDDPRISAGEFGDPVYMRFWLDEPAYAYGIYDFKRLAEHLKKTNADRFLPELTCPALIMASGSQDHETQQKLSLAKLSACADKTLVFSHENLPGSGGINADGQDRARAIIGDWLIQRLGV